MAKWCHVFDCWESDIEEVIDMDKSWVCDDCKGCEEVGGGELINE